MLSYNVGLGRWGNTPHLALTNEVQAAALILPAQGHGQEDQQLTMLLEVLLGSELPKGRVTLGVHIAQLHGNRMILLLHHYTHAHCHPKHLQGHCHSPKAGIICINSKCLSSPLEYNLDEVRDHLCLFQHWNPVSVVTMTPCQ